MSVATWTGRCTGCGGEDVEVCSRRTHAERVLCAACAAKPYSMPSASGLNAAAAPHRPNGTAARAPATSSDRPRAGAHHRTDQGNAERLVDTHRRDIRYVPGLGWHAWDGRRWRPDDDGEVLRRAKSVTRDLYAELAGIEDAIERKAAAKHAERSDSEPRLRAAVSLARSERKVIARSTDLDARPDLLNVQNGTIELGAGTLRPHDRDDLLTKLAPVTYRADARDDRWERFLHDSTGGDSTMAAFLQRAVGYTLTGSTAEEVLFFAHGPAATGKSTFLEALKATLGEYARTADFEAFLARRGDGGVRSDLARLAGARLVLGVEVEDGKRLAEGLLKQLTGGDTVTARFMYQDFFEYRPQFKLWLGANHRPRVSASDEAIWRRIIQVPFLEVVPPDRRDPALKRALTTDPDARSAILAWAVQGCFAWHRDGLNVPASVVDYTAEYRAENDPLAIWLDDTCELRPDATATAAELRASYEHWASREGDRPIGSRKFADALKARGCHNNDRGTGGVRIWRGICLTPRSDA